MDENDYRKRELRSRGFICMEPTEVAFLDGSKAIVQATSYRQSMERPGDTARQKAALRLYSVQRAAAAGTEILSELELETQIGAVELQRLRANLLRDLTLDEFLIVVGARDLHGNYVVPGEDVRERLSHEIELRTNIPCASLSGETVKEERKWVSAKAGEFISQTRIAIEALAAFLLQQSANRFQIAFHNIAVEPNEFGDRVLVALRYTQAQ